MLWIFTHVVGQTFSYKKRVSGTWLVEYIITFLTLCPFYFLLFKLKFVNLTRIENIILFWVILENEISSLNIWQISRTEIYFCKARNFDQSEKRRDKISFDWFRAKTNPFIWENFLTFSRQKTWSHKLKPRSFEQWDHDCGHIWTWKWQETGKPTNLVWIRCKVWTRTSVPIQDWICSKHLLVNDRCVFSIFP